MEPQRIAANMPTSQQVVRTLQSDAARRLAIQVESDADISQYFETAVFNPLAQTRRFLSLNQMAASTLEETNEVEKEQALHEKLDTPAKIDDAAERFQKNNYELNAKTLKILREQVAEGDTPDEILQKVRTIYKDPALGDEAFEFLLETSDGALQLATMEAREKLHREQGKQVRAGRNMGAQAREFAEKGLGSATSLRDLYRDITLNPREPLKLFEELTNRFSYYHLKTALHFILHSLGADLASKGPSIERSELLRLLDETRSVQGILTLFRFFQSRMRLIYREFGAAHIPIPQNLDFELLGRVFAKVLAERFMSPERLLTSSAALGIQNSTKGKIIIYTQMRDALRQIPPKYFRDPKHQEELMKVFLEMLEDLEEKREEEEEKEK